MRKSLMWVIAMSLCGCQSAPVPKSPKSYPRVWINQTIPLEINQEVPV